MKKQSRVIFITSTLQESYDSFPENHFLRKAIRKAVASLSNDAFCGIQIQKRLIPQSYVRMGIKNLWKINLPKGWRLLYTVTASHDVELLTAILEWSDHTSYERRFSY